MALLLSDPGSLLFGTSWKNFAWSFFFISELESERRALEESEREKRLLASRLEDLSGRLELSERERREV